MKRTVTFFKELLIINSSLLILTSCSINKQISKSATQLVIKDSSLTTAHFGISIYEPATSKYWYNYQDDKYFVPASNTKIPTCYAAMKYLGDSLVGLRYGIPEEQMYHNSMVVMQPTGDPTFLHNNFKSHPVFNLLSKELVLNGKTVGFMDTVWKDERWGNGWCWNDYGDSYMAERNSFPVFGNVIEIRQNDKKDTTKFSFEKFFNTTPTFFDSIINENWQGEYFDRQKFTINRNISANKFDFAQASTSFKNQIIPFVTFDDKTAFDVLNNILHKDFSQ